MTQKKQGDAIPSTALTVMEAGCAVTIIVA